MYKLNKKNIVRSAIIIGSMSLSFSLYGCKNKEEIEREEIAEQETVDSQEKGKVLIDQDLNGCVVYKILSRTREQDIQKNSFGPWQNWSMSDEFYIGSISENYNKIIHESDTKEIQKIVMGFVNNDYTMEDFYVTSKTYYQEVIYAGKIERTEEELTIDNDAFDLPARCMCRWTLDTTRIREEQRFPQTQDNKLMRKYTITSENGELQYTPTYEFTTFTNLPNTGIEYQEVGTYQISKELQKEHNKKLVYANV